MPFQHTEAPLEVYEWAEALVVLDEAKHLSSHAQLKQEDSGFETITLAELPNDALVYLSALITVRESL